MKDLLEKITSYNLFNYLLPGVLFVTILDKFTIYSFTQENLVIGAFVYYFVGLVISRFGSLVIDPFLKRISFLKFAAYEDFVSVSKQDPKVEIFSEINNMYRTFCAMFVLLVLAKLYEWIEYKIPFLMKWNFYFLIALLLITFLFSYKKQTEYIKRRITTSNRS